MFSLILVLLLLLLFRFAFDTGFGVGFDVGVAVAAPASNAVVWSGFWLWKAAILACLAAATAMVTEAGRGVVDWD